MTPRKLAVTVLGSLYLPSGFCPHFKALQDCPYTFFFLHVEECVCWMEGFLNYSVALNQRCGAGAEII